MGDRDDAKDAGRSGRDDGDPAYDVREGLDAGKIGLFPALDGDFRPEAVVGGTFLADNRVGLDSRETPPLPTTTQLAPRPPATLSRCILFDALDGVV